MVKKEEKEKQKILEERGIQLLLLDQELKKIEEQYRLLDQSIVNIELIKANLDEIKGIKGKEVMVNLAEGVMIKANVEKIDKVFVNIGKGIVVEKNVEEAKKFLDKKIDEIYMLKSLLSSEAQKILDEILAIEEEIKRLRE
jgi:prefoldin alpha subunit